MKKHGPPQKQRRLTVTEARLLGVSHFWRVELAASGHVRLFRPVMEWTPLLSPDEFYSVMTRFMDFYARPNTKLPTTTRRVTQAEARYFSIPLRARWALDVRGRVTAVETLQRVWAPVHGDAAQAAHRLLSAFWRSEQAPRGAFVRGPMAGSLHNVRMFLRELIQAGNIPVKFKRRAHALLGEM